MSKLAELRAKFNNAHTTAVSTSRAVIEKMLEDGRITDDDGKVYDSKRFDYLPFLQFIDQSSDTFIKKAIKTITEVVKLNPSYELQLMGNWSSRNLKNMTELAILDEQKATDEEVTGFILEHSSDPTHCDVDRVYKGMMYSFQQFNEFCDKFVEEMDALIEVLDAIPEKEPRKLVRAKPRS